MFAINTNQKTQGLLGLVVLGTSIALLSACGSTADTDASAVASSQAPQHSIQRCLERHGAARARTIDDLAVLSRAESEDEVSKPGFAYDKAASIVVNVWTGSSIENRPAPWMLWIGHPLGKDFTPQEIVKHKPPKSYVVYVTNAGKRRHAEKCLTFSDEGEGPPAEINLSGR